MLGRKSLIRHLKENIKVLKSPRIIRAFEKIDRADFVRSDYAFEVYEDYPLPIGHGQTISQPTTVAFMIELLSPQEGDKILDVGSGSGWTTALLSEIVGQSGGVYGLERIPELVDFGRNNLKKYKFKNAEIFQAGEALGLPDKAPFDRILVSAGADELPKKLLEQLKIGGIMIIPIGDSIFKIIKTTDKEIKKEEYKGFVFVPLIT